MSTSDEDRAGEEDKPLPIIEDVGTKANGYETDSHIFGINPHDKTLPLQQDSGVFPGAHESYRVFNIGRSEVYAKAKYGTKVNWIGTITSATVQPRERATLDNGGRPYYVTGLKLYNQTDTRVIVNGEGGELVYSNNPGPNFDTNKLLKEAFALGVKYIPYVGSALSGLIKTFWPENKPNVWEDIQDKVAELIDDKIVQLLKAILDGDIRYFGERIKALEDEMEGVGPLREVSSHYMNIAQDLVGFENKFNFSAVHPDYKNVNFIVLPHYSNFVYMKLSFYVRGIANQAKFGLTDRDVADVKRYATRTIKGDSGAISYITSMYKERVDHTYNTVFAGGIFNELMTVRTHIAVHGLEYIPTWNYMLDNPASTTQPYNDVISYSRFYGRMTPNLGVQSTPTDLNQPLMPNLIGGKRNKLKSVQIFYWRIYGTGPTKIGGMKITFANGNSYSMGTTSNEQASFELKDATITKLTAFGGGAIDCLVFFLSDGQQLSYGTVENQTHDNFELKDHHIVSLYLSSDAKSLGGQAANVTVAYQLNENLEA